MLIRDVLGTI